MTESVLVRDQKEEEGEEEEIQKETSTFDLNQLPDSFRKFLDDNSIDPAIYTVTHLPRYFRINTHLPEDKRPTLEDLKKQLNTDQVHKVKGIDNFYSVQLADVRLSDTPVTVENRYKERAIFGIDLSSAIAVEALFIKKDDQVLDLCCAPGAKLCMISNLFGRDGLGTVTGVDIAGHRLAICRSLLKKYKVGERVRLFEADGTQFSIPPPSRLGGKVIAAESSHKRQKTNITKPFYASKMLRSDRQLNQGVLYDKVLVDAECTHDGSILHILKYEKWGWDSFEKNFMDKDRLNTITDLQRNLMKQGWSMLKKGGIMVYSTCSLTISQNEENVAWFLGEFSDAQIERIPDCHIRPSAIKNQSVNSELQQVLEEYCVRFDPLASRTSGFFVVKFSKKSE
ncbi:hypothetical protein G6F56_003488 [Rhizopus delemar]|nr:hypothetical protein G6F56_003488 [Rhizopus delemar]